LPDNCQDNSGSYSRVYPCKSYKRAQKKLKNLLEKEYETSYHLDWWILQTIKTVHKYDIKFNLDERYHQIKEEEKMQRKEYLEGLIKKLQNDLNKLNNIS
jgi:hypothetical protein